VTGAADNDAHREIDMRGVLSVLLILTLAPVGLSACGKPDITSYDECVAAGHPRLKTYPGQCVMPDGRRFVQTVTEPPAICVNQCGNGQCQEMVCLGSGCPCAETAESCSQDCGSKP
ncbi:MAG: hypothetical protein ACRESW_04795, partial [Nevskiales bacterium]